MYDINGSKQQLLVHCQYEENHAPFTSVSWIRAVGVGDVDDGFEHSRADAYQLRAQPQGLHQQHGRRDERISHHPAQHEAGVVVVQFNAKKHRKRKRKHKK